nr:kinesin-like protein KIF3B [Cherax quadricarinatus]
MSGGRRKSRKPQKWEDYVADEEQLATIEKELVKEEKARMKCASNDGDSSEKSPDGGQDEEDDDDNDTTDEEGHLQIVIQKDESEEFQTDKELIKEEILKMSSVLEFKIKKRSSGLPLKKKIMEK